MIIVPNRKILTGDQIVNHSSNAGIFTLRIGKLQPDGTLAVRRTFTAACKPQGKQNLITDQGLNRMGTENDYLDYCSVGFGNVTPAFTDTSLADGKAVAAYGTGPGGTRGAVAGSTPYAFTRRVYRFAAGVATGNITEVGIQWGNTIGPTLYSRALTLDVSGNPVAIEKLADETLDVSYELRTYSPTVDVEGETVIGSETYEYIIRACKVNQIKGQFGPGWGPRYFAGSEFIGSASYTGTAGSNMSYSGTIGTTTGEPSGAQVGAPGLENVAYSTGTLSRSFKHTYGTSIDGDIRSVLYSAGWNSYQIQFTPALPKESGNNIWLEFNHSWGRKTL